MPGPLLWPILDRYHLFTLAVRSAALPLAVMAPGDLLREIA